MDHYVPVKAFVYDHNSNSLKEKTASRLFLKGPIPLDWLQKAADLPGKALNVALALLWLDGMQKGKAVKLTKKARIYFNFSTQAARDAISRLEKVGLIQVFRRQGEASQIVIARS